MDQEHLWVGEYRGFNFRVSYLPCKGDVGVCVSMAIPGTEEFINTWCRAEDVGLAMERLARKGPQSPEANAKKATGTGG